MTDDLGKTFKHKSLGLRLDGEECKILTTESKIPAYTTKLPYLLFAVAFFPNLENAVYFNMVAVLFLT